MHSDIYAFNHCLIQQGKKNVKALLKIPIQILEILQKLGTNKPERKNEARPKPIDVHIRFEKKQLSDHCILYLGLYSNAKGKSLKALKLDNRIKNQEDYSWWKGRVYTGDTETEPKHKVVVMLQANECDDSA